MHQRRRTHPGRIRRQHLQSREAERPWLSCPRRAELDKWAHCTSRREPAPCCALQRREFLQTGRYRTAPGRPKILRSSSSWRRSSLERLGITTAPEQGLSRRLRAEPFAVVHPTAGHKRAAMGRYDQAIMTAARKSQSESQTTFNSVAGARKLSPSADSRVPNI